MKYYTANSIFGEKITTYIYGMILFMFSIVLFIFMFLAFNWIIIPFFIISISMLFYTVYNIYLITKNTVKYKIVFYDDYLKIIKKNGDLIVEYNRIESMYYKSSFSVMTSGVWRYLEINCGLDNPIYVSFPVFINYHYPIIEALKRIGNEKFKKKYNLFLKCNKTIEKRNLSNIL